jgi:hypothetical protein
MLDLFMQVPVLVRKRLAVRCKHVYEGMRECQRPVESDDDAGMPVRAVTTRTRTDAVPSICPDVCDPTSYATVPCQHLTAGPIVLHTRCWNPSPIRLSLPSPARTPSFPTPAGAECGTTPGPQWR